jgi:hypothetical protein
VGWQEGRAHRAIIAAYGLFFGNFPGAAARRFVQSLLFPYCSLSGWVEQEDKEEGSAAKHRTKVSSREGKFP